MDAALRNTRYVNLTTFRKDGRAVGTPVWVVPIDGKLYLYTSNTTGKVKRIRATKKVKVAPSTGRGRPTGGWSEGTGRVVSEPALVAEANAAIKKKYGFQHYLVQLIIFITRQGGNRVVVELTV